MRMLEARVKRQIVNGLYLYSAFLVLMTSQSTLQFAIQTVHIWAALFS